MHVGGPSCGARGQRGHGRTQHTRAACVCAKGSETGVTHFERSARRCQARLSLRGEAAVARHKSAEHAFRREVVCYPCSSENLSQYRNRDTARYLAIKCDKWRCCAMLAIMRALHSPRPRLSDDATRVKRYKRGRAPSPLRPWRFARSARVARLDLAGYTPRGLHMSSNSSDHGNSQKKKKRSRHKCTATALPPAEPQRRFEFRRTSCSGRRPSSRLSQQRA